MPYRLRAIISYIVGNGNYKPKDLNLIKCICVRLIDNSIKNYKLFLNLLLQRPEKH